MSIYLNHILLLYVMITEIIMIGLVSSNRRFRYVFSSLQSMQSLWYTSNSVLMEAFDLYGEVKTTNRTL